MYVRSPPFLHAARQAGCAQLTPRVVRMGRLLERTIPEPPPTIRGRMDAPKENEGAKMRRILFALGLVVAGAPAPSPEQVPALAREWLVTMREVRVDLPEGGTVAPAGEILDASRLEHALTAIGDEGGWPKAWLVIQDLTRSYDLVLRAELGADGKLTPPSTIFAAARVEWTDATFDEAYRKARGERPPKEKHRSLVVLTFSKTLRTTYVYDLPKTGKEAKGLLALLPEGAYLREAAAVDLGDGARHTLALILMRPSFLPSACGEGDGPHRDRGGVRLYLAGEKELEGALDLAPAFGAPADGELELSRYACTPEDASPAAADRSLSERFLDRESIRLLATKPRPGGGADVLVAGRVVAKAVILGEVARLKPVD